MNGLLPVYDALQANFILVIALVMATVGFLKEIFGLEGTGVRVLSFIVGIVFAVVISLDYFLPVAGPYIQAVFFILGAGLFASGFFDLGVDVRNGG